MGQLLNLHGLAHDDLRVEVAEAFHVGERAMADLLRFFGLWNARAGSPFARATWSVELIENLRFELGGGAFLGDDRGLLGLIADSDFVVARLRLYF